MTDNAYMYIQCTCVHMHCVHVLPYAYMYLGDVRALRSRLGGLVSLLPLLRGLAALWWSGYTPAGTHAQDVRCIYTCTVYVCTCKIDKVHSTITCMYTYVHN